MRFWRPPSPPSVQRFLRTSFSRLPEQCVLWPLLCCFKTIYLSLNAVRLQWQAFAGEGLQLSAELAGKVFGGGTGGKIRLLRKVFDFLLIASQELMQSVPVQSTDEVDDDLKPSLCCQDFVNIYELNRHIFQLQMCLPGCTEGFCTVDSMSARSKVQTHSWHLPNRNMEAFRGRAVGRNVRAVGDLCLCQYIISFFTWLFLIILFSFRALKLS